MFADAIAEPAFKALELIEQNSALDIFYLAGGTSSAIQMGHRVSVDLDFFTKSEFDPDNFAKNFQDLNMTNVIFDIGTYKFELENAQVSFFEYRYPITSPLINFRKIKLASLEDIALMKITAIASRGSKKDFIDLFFIFQNLNSSEVLSKFNLKFQEANYDKYHFLKSLTYFDDAELEPDPLMLVDWNWGEIKRYFGELVKQIEF